MRPRFAYFDTSLLVPLYVQCAASVLARQAMAEATRNGVLPVVISELTGVEFVSAIAKYVRMRQMTREEAQTGIALFERHCRDAYALLPIRPSDYETARRWIRELSTSLKTLDGVHMAAASANGCILVTADKQLAAAAVVFDVEHYFVPYN